MEEKVIKEIDDTIIKIAQDIKEGSCPAPMMTSSLAELIMARKSLETPHTNGSTYGATRISALIDDKPVSGFVVGASEPVTAESKPTMARKPYSKDYIPADPDPEKEGTEFTVKRIPYTGRVGLVDQYTGTEWRRFEPISADADLIDQFETLCREKGLTRKDLATILLTLRIRHGFGRADFGI